jgi:hypothetical protein
MGMMIVRHKVKDYGQWRPIFDGLSKCRGRAGLIPAADHNHRFGVPLAGLVLALC